MLQVFIAVVPALGLALALAFMWRVVVPTNVVHIVQSRKTTVSYGKGQSAGNVYYNVPSFVPFFGLTRIVLPVNNFAIRLDGYEAYDKDRAPFDLDLIGFFQIVDTNLAAQRAASFAELEAQLKSIMQGAARTILAQHDINSIMGDRATFGEAFTKEVDGNVDAWGVKSVKALELMDIRDAKGSKIIADIMAKKASHIEMESRTAVAANKKEASIAELQAQQEVKLREQQVLEEVGKRTATQQKNVGIENERAHQEVQAEAKVTMDRKMAVAQVATVRQAEITRDAAVVKAEEDQRTAVIRAEGERQMTITIATGNKDAALLAAQGIEAEGKAKGAAEQAMLVAPVNAQIMLAEKIAELPAYQTYLVQIREVEARERIGVENAKALADANIKVIATAGDATEGIASVGDVLGPRGGVKLGAMLEGLANTETGSALLSRLGIEATDTAPKPRSKPNGAAA